MGLFSGQQPSANQDGQEGQDYMASEAVQVGNDTRLGHTLGRDPEGIFTSNLSVGEYLLLGESGFEPLGFVFGSSIYHIGIQLAKFSQNQELNVLTQAMYNARELAFTRMRKEAEDLGADGIVEVDITLQNYLWGHDVLEFVATGTAVRSMYAPGTYRTTAQKPFTANLSAHDFYKLVSAGLVPVNFVFGTCVYHVAHQNVMQSMKQSYQNQEMANFTTGIYTARELALTRMQNDAEKSSVIGIIGVKTAISPHVWGEHATEFLAMGTAVRRIKGDSGQPAALKPTYTLPL